MKKKKIAISLLVISGILLILALAFLIYFFTLNRELDLSLIRTGASSVTKIYYFDYEDRKNRIGKEVELKDEELFLQKSEWTSLYDMPKNLSNAFIAVEDKRFYEHKGIDVLRTGKAVLNYIFGKNKSSFGGSTITQQLIKNLTGENQITVRRKIEEILRAVNLETKLSKNEILELYLNVVYLSQNCYGVGTGAEVYFGKDVSELSLSECAVLASIVKSPTKYDPYKNEENNIERRNVVLKEMLNQGMITDSEYQNALEEQIIINDNIENENKSGVYSWYTEALISEVATDLAEKNKISFESARKLILKGGLNIYSTIDPNIQENSEEIYENYSKYILPQDGKYPESACVIIDPQTSDILALVGGVGKKNANMIFNRATNAKRPPGSVIKPLSVYGPAIDKNLITYATVLDDTPVQIKNNIAWPKNSPDRYRGLVPIYYAIEHSINTIAVKVLQKLGIDTSISYLNSFLINVSEEDKNDSSLALGQLTNGESLLNLTNAYTAFTNGGKISNPKTYLYVKDNYGNIVLEKETKENQVISRESADIMTKMLINVVENGTASSVKLNNKNIAVAGKTGTSSNNEDRWFIGYTPDYVCGVWTGFDTPKPIYSAKNPSCIIFNEIFNKIYNNEDEKSDFEISDSVVEKEFCFDSGKLPISYCDKDMRGKRTVLGYFKKGTEPKIECDLHKEAIIDISDGLESHIASNNFNKRRVYLIDYKRNKYPNIKILDTDYLLSSVKREE
ncbi:MAG: PBP1A family penicillin-binding protein [Clostridia bacterium]|nr:PBP1A family penicillin-binding protein [Clostridia bacterium]